MKTQRMLTFLRTHRRSWGLTLRELADLLGFKSSAHVSRIEQGKRTPSTETALACTALFGEPLHELFPQLADEVDERFKARADRLREGLRQSTTHIDARKRELLDRVLADAARSDSTTEV